MLKPFDCRQCVLSSISQGFSLQEGRCTNGVLIMGEALGHNEFVAGLPFRPNGAAGSLLEQAFRITRTNREEYLIDNIIRCQPPGDELVGRGYENSAIAYCTATYGTRVYSDPRVKAVLALGATAFRSISGITGKKLGVGDCRGYVLPSILASGVPVVGSYHPAHIRRGKLAYTAYLVHDLRKALAVAQGRYKSYCSDEEYEKYARYQLGPSIDDAKSFAYRVRDNPNLTLGYDIETPNSQEAEEDEREEVMGEPIESIQFSLGKGEGIWFPWEGTYIKIAKAILKLRNRKLGFNIWHFDNPKLYANGCEINGELVDLMWKWHHLYPDLEMGLQKVASMCDFMFIWKHFAKDKRRERFYGVVDAEVLFWIEEKIDRILEMMKVPTVSVA